MRRESTRTTSAKPLGRRESGASARPGAGTEQRRAIDTTGKARSAPKAPGAEALLVELMLSDPAAAARVDDAGGLELFVDTEWRALAEDLVVAVKRGTPLDPATVLARLDDATAARITGRLLAETTGSAEMTQIVDDCLARLRAQALESESQVLLRRIRDAAASGNDRAVEEGLREKLALDRQRELLVRQQREAEGLAIHDSIAKG